MSPRRGLADLVADGPKTVAELAAGSHADGPSLGRLLRALASLKIFAEDSDGRYRQTALNDTLRAIHSNGTLLLVETVLAPSSDPASALMDLLMMVLTGGRERTEPELRSLLADTNFPLTRVIPTAGSSIIEALPV